MIQHTTRRLAGVVALAAALAACGGGDDTADAPTDTVPAAAPTSQVPTTVATTAAPTDTAAPTTAAPSEPTQPTGGLETVQPSVIQIEATGTFVDPEFGAYEGAGRGSGFVIDMGGSTGQGNIAVTNNHVVTGAGKLEVFVHGEDTPRNAKVLGVSECSDLAVIEIGGAPIPSLSWFSGANAPGTEVYVAGFPLGDPEYTLTRGVISKERAGGDTSWASIDHAIEHDASSQPGNSGGPLVTADTLVAGVHYASSAQTNQSQFYAIAADVAKPIVDDLAAGTDVDSVGINGQIVANEDGSITGLWVSGVKSGSAADEAGVQPGDIVTRIEGVSVGLDGTMRDYCDVLRSHDADDQLAIEVLRYSTAEVLEGELNGDWLVTAFSFAEELGDDAASGDAYADYMTVTDDTGTITVQVPTAWAELDGTSIDLGDGLASPSITASPDIEGYRNTWATPGMEFLASEALAGTSAGEMLDLVTPADCESLGRTDYDDGFFVGQYENFVSCGGTNTEYVVVATNSVDGRYGVLVAVQVVTVADYEALDQIMRSFNVAV